MIAGFPELWKYKHDNKMAYKIPLVSMKLRSRMWFIISSSCAFLLYSSMSSFFPQLWEKLGFSAGDKVILTIGMVIILLIALSGIALAEKSQLPHQSSIDEWPAPNLKSKNPHTKGHTEVDHISTYFNSMLVELQKKLGQVNQHAKSLAEANESLARLAVKDGLTGLYNQSYAKERLQQEFYRSQRYKNPLSLLMFDIDNFKALNDKYGHLAGDDVLRIIARMTVEIIRPSDIPSRYGGEEFFFILPETNQHEAGLLAERIRQRIISYPFRHNSVKEKTYNTTISAGTCTFPDYGNSAGELITFCDAALYGAKKAGKNQVVIYNG